MLHLKAYSAGLSVARPRNVLLTPIYRLLHYDDRYYRHIVCRGYNGMEKAPPADVYDRNQIFEGNTEANVEGLLKSFKTSIEVSFGYGSGVFQQLGYTGKSTPQIDLIHLVRNAQQFHEGNLHQYPEHYSGVKYFGGSHAVEKVQRLGAGIYFNPYVKMKDESGRTSSIKYGTIELRDALLDLTEWSSLYIAGRLQKPVKLMHNFRPLITFANQYNLKNALAVGILLIKPQNFDEYQLYESITKISYLGDLRMLVGGENPNKARNIVSKQYDSFKKLYGPLIEYMLTHGVLVRVNGDDNVAKFSRTSDSRKISNLLQTLPIQFRRKLYKQFESKYAIALSQDPIAQSTITGKALCDITDLDESMLTSPFADSVASDPQLRKSVVRAIKRTVAYPALVQTIKGIFSAGLMKSVQYAWEKNTKFRNS